MKGLVDDFAYDYYVTSLMALQMQNMYLPLRSKYYHKNDYLKNLLIHNSHINIIQNDLIFKLEEKHHEFLAEKESNGYFVNLSTNTNSPSFNWYKHFEENFPLKNFSSSILYGKDNGNKKGKIQLMGEQYDSFLAKISKAIFTNEKKFPLPICFPRRYYCIGGVEKLFVNDMSVFCNIKPFINYPLRYLREFKRWQKEFEFQIKLSLSSLGKDKSFEYKEATESVFNLIYVYKDYAENVLNIFDDESEGDDDEDD